MKFFSLSTLFTALLFTDLALAMYKAPEVRKGGRNQVAESRDAKISRLEAEIDDLDVLSSSYLIGYLDTKETLENPHLSEAQRSSASGEMQRISNAMAVNDTKLSLKRSELKEFRGW